MDCCSANVRLPTIGGEHLAFFSTIRGI